MGVRESDAIASFYLSRGIIKEVTRCQFPFGLPRITGKVMLHLLFIHNAELLKF